MEDFIEVNGAKVCFQITGTGQPMMFIHGGGLDKRMWDRQLEFFSQRYTVLRYDLPGFGKSEIPRQPFFQIEILKTLVETLNLVPIHLCGLSLGGRIALDFAVEHPSLVKTLILIAPGLSGYAWSETLLKQFALIEQAIKEGGALRAAEQWLQDPHMIPAMQNPHIRDLVRQIHIDNAGMWTTSIPEKPIRPPAIDRLSTLPIPTLTIVGDRDVPDIHRIMDILNTTIRNVHSETMLGAGHLPNLEMPDEFNQIVLKFLRTHQ